MTLKDTQVIELSGRHFLISQLLAAGIEVAQPIRDRGIDLIAYLDRDGEMPQFIACPIQMKANQGARFMLDRKYEAVPNLLMVYVWHVSKASSTVVVALSYSEVFTLLRQQGHTKTRSWIEEGIYSLQVNEAWRARLSPYEMSASTWRERILRTSALAQGREV